MVASMAITKLMRQRHAKAARNLQPYDVGGVAVAFPFKIEPAFGVADGESTSVTGVDVSFPLSLRSVV